MFAAIWKLEVDGPIIFEEVSRVITKLPPATLEELNEIENLQRIRPTLNNTAETPGKSLQNSKYIANVQPDDLVVDDNNREAKQQISIEAERTKQEIEAKYNKEKQKVQLNMNQQQQKTQENNYIEKEFLKNNPADAFDF